MSHLGCLKTDMDEIAKTFKILMFFVVNVFGALREPKMTSKMAQDRPRWLKMAPKMLQEAPRPPQDGSKWPRSLPKEAPKRQKPF